MRRFVLAFALAGLLSGCVTTPQPDGLRLTRQAAAGQRFALRACAGCHATGLDGASRNDQAPPFRTLAARLPDTALEAHLGAIAQQGHVQMPPIYMTPGEIGAVAAYIRAVAAAKPA